MSKKIVLRAKVDHQHRAFIKDAGVTTFELARYMGLSANTCYSIMSGTRKPTPKQSIKIRELVAALKAGTVVREEQLT